MSNHKRNAVVEATREEVNAAWESVSDCVDADLLQVRAIAEKHGGVFELISRQWVGTEIILDFPKESIVDTPPGPEPITAGPVAAVAA